MQMHLAYRLASLKIWRRGQAGLKKRTVPYYPLEREDKEKSALLRTIFELDSTD